MEQIEVHPRVSVNGISSFQWTIEQDIALCQSLGLAVIGVPFFKLDRDGMGGVAAVQRSGLRCSSFVGGTMGMSLITPREGGKLDALPALQASIDVAQALQSPMCYFTSGTAPSRMSTDDAFDALVQALQPAVAYARGKGVRLALEHNSTPTRDNGFVHTLADAAELAREVDVDIDLELQNCWYERHLDRLFKDNVKRFAVAQVSDFKVGEVARLNRRVPGDGDMPLEWLLGHLLDAGYTGLFEVEILGPKIEEEGYASAIRRSVQWLSERLRTWGA